MLSSPVFKKICSLTGHFLWPSAAKLSFFDKTIWHMELEVVAFGIARDILGQPNLNLEVDDTPLTVAKLLETLKTRYPAFRDLASLAVAVNAAYATPDQVIIAGDEVVLIPPVAGG
jgi:molybdopterin converting factor subunit 1